jgi:DNA gyrase subunit B
MPELVERGYLYIAQPPLLKVGKGKNQVYLKDEGEFNDFILKRICEEKTIYMGSEDRELRGHTLYLFLGNLSEFNANLEKLERRGIESDFIELLLREGVTDKSFIEDRSKMQALRETLLKKGYRVGDLTWNEERNAYNLEVAFTPKQRMEDMPRNAIPVTIGRGLIYSKPYQDLVVLGKKVFPYDLPPFRVIQKKREAPTEPRLIENKKRLLTILIEEGRKGLGVQRYKGLGEMNPEQLWETTMNPETRNLLQVRIEDVVDTDEIFTVLMGEEVEPRREFIQSNALEVSMLDI